jgi:hypothetical protein
LEVFAARGNARGFLCLLKSMSPEILFWLAIAVKMVIAASVVIGATVAAERTGPLIGALIATLPVSAGPAYFFLAFEKDAAFISQGALGSLLLNAATAIYAATYVLLAQKRPFIIAVPGAMIAWLGCLFLFSQFARTATAAAIFNIVTFSSAYIAVRPYRDARMKQLKLYWYDFAFRAGLVGILVGIILSLSVALGPVATGALAAFPIIFTSMMLILHHRYGGPACAAVMANGVVGLIGFGIAAFVLHFAALSMGVVPALLLALGITVAWNFGIFLLKRRGKIA